MIKISERLKSLVKYIHTDDKIMDVGCDHAILDIYLVQTGVLHNIYVCDVNPNALANGKENIEKYELGSNIFPILSYGIEKINELDVDTLVISGMGSKNIIEILSSPNLDRVYKLVLQSNNNHNELRRFLVGKGFRIFAEEIIKDGKKTYVNILAGRDMMIPNYNDIEFEFGPLLITNPDNLEYFEEQLRSNEQIYYSSHSEETRKKISYLEEIIEQLKKNGD